ncbi:MAG: hypothetical protein M2R45_03348 [Verrucomicrobia subdivision 3 bacterium]|nr:hypothetical protein [Limisphaerales bacterium]MCS1416738.1 hypothetical protein [Limisphaerales bacterium]
MAASSRLNVDTIGEVGRDSVKPPSHNARRISGYALAASILSGFLPSFVERRKRAA